MRSCISRLKKVLSVFVAWALTLTLVPAQAFADESQSLVLTEPAQGQVVLDEILDTAPNLADKGDSEADGSTQEMLSADPSAEEAETDQLPESTMPDAAMPEEKPEEDVAPQGGAEPTDSEQLILADDPADETTEGPAPLVIDGPEEADAQEEPVIEVQEEEGLPEVVSEESAVVEESAEADRVTYRTHAIGGSWSGNVYDGAQSGTTGSGRGIDSIKISYLAGADGTQGGITYRAFVQKKGWLDWKSDGSRSGSANGLRIEALQIKLTGAAAKKYDVYYSVHVQGYGWLGWAKNGAPAGTCGKSLRIEAIKVQLVGKGLSAPSSKGVDVKSPFVDGASLAIQASVQRYGWLEEVGSGATAGTTGKSLRLEAIRANLVGAQVSGGISLQSHVQGKGWTSWRKGFTGTTGRSKRLEAFAAKLTGEAAKTYDLYYRAHVSHIGWMGWAKNGQKAGTVGMSARVEAVQFRLVKKGGKAPSSSTPAYYKPLSVHYRAYCQNDGWKSEVKNGAVAGTTGQGKRLEAFTARLSGGNVRGTIKYSAYVAGRGWQSARSANQIAGTSGEARAVQAIKIKLTSQARGLYDVYYRVHMAQGGWLGWAKNGQVAGAPGVGKDVQALEVRLVVRGGMAPGGTSGHVVDRNFFDDAMTQKAQGYSSPTGWLILVDTTRTKLAVFRGSQGNWNKYASWRISCGQPQTPTVKGVFSVGDRGYVFGHGYSCYYYTQFYGAYLFHSIKYHEGTFNVMDGRLGEHISMGCVRMEIGRAKWIYDTIPSGTTVVTY